MLAAERWKAERDRYKAALERIADRRSRQWEAGDIAREALAPPAEQAAAEAAGPEPDAIEVACAAAWGGDHWPNVPNAEGEREYMRKALAAVERLRAEQAGPEPDFPAPSVVGEQP